jgi:hypothetical protein
MSGKLASISLGISWNDGKLQPVIVALIANRSTCNQAIAGTGAGMNLLYAHKLLVAASARPHGFLRIHGRHADHQVRLMAEAGLVEATLSDGKTKSFTSINRLTDFGRTFLRAFENHPGPAPASSSIVHKIIPPGITAS